MLNSNDETSDMLNSIRCLYHIVLLTCSSLTNYIKYEIIIFLHYLNKYGKNYLWISELIYQYQVFC
jgi:hypothetical protein